jgi:hypothetical protein
MCKLKKKLKKVFPRLEISHPALTAILCYDRKKKWGMKRATLYRWGKRKYKLKNVLKSKSKITGCSFKFILKVGVEESIVNAPRITDHGST